MPEFLTTRSTASQLETLIEDAEQQLTLISPYLQIPTNLLPRLRAADARGVAIRLVFRTGELKPGEKEKLSGLKRLSLFSLDKLHAKCYANERMVLVSSMNLYQYSEQNNWEMSVLLTEQHDSAAIQKARREIESIIREATSHPARTGVRSVLTNVFGRASTSPATQKQVNTKEGFCIRCSDKIRYYPQSPLCKSCYAIWSTWGNDDYPENACHRCARSSDVTKAKPLCMPCFREAPFSAGGL